MYGTIKSGEVFGGSNVAIGFKPVSKNIHRDGFITRLFIYSQIPLTLIINSNNI